MRVVAQLVPVVEHPLGEAGEVVAHETVVVQHVGADMLLLVNYLLVLIEKNQLLIGLADVKNGVNSLFYRFFHSPVDTLCLPRWPMSCSRTPSAR